MAFLFLRFRISFDYIPEDIGRTREQHFASRTKDAGKCWTLEVSCYNNKAIGEVGYMVSRKISKDGKYLGVGASYNIDDHKAMAKLSYTW